MAESEERQSRIQVGFRKQVSDGNYGTEAAEYHLDYWTDPEEDPETINNIAEDMLGDCSRVVHARLAVSLSAQVRRAVQPVSVPPAVPEPEDEGDEVPF